MVDVPGELVAYLARLLAAERRALGTRALSCVKQALLVLVWFRKNENIELLAAGFEVSQATGYRYIAEGRRVLAAQAPDLHDALRQAAEQGWAYVVLDGSLIGTDRCTQTTTSVKGDQIDAWYSGKHRQPGGNIQAFLRPTACRSGSSTSCPATFTTSPAPRPTRCWPPPAGQRPNCTYPRWPTPAKAPASAYTPRSSNPPTAADNRAYNTLLRAARAPGERGYALLKGCWPVLRHVTASPTAIGEITRGALVLTTFLYERQPKCC